MSLGRGSRVSALASLLLLLLAAFVALPASAAPPGEETAPPPEASDDDAPTPDGGEAAPDDEDAAGEPRFRATVFGRVGFGQLDEDYFVSIAPGAVFRYEPIAVAVEVPLRFRVVDESPRQGGVLRDEDWDEASDFTKILRYFEYGRRGDPLYARLGELTGVTLGHGTIIDSYYNTIFVDHYQTGVEASFDGRYAGGQLLLDNVVDPNLFGVRVFVRPLSFVGVAEVFQDLEIGLTYASDYQAPGTIRRQTAGTGPPLVTSDGELSASTEVVTLYGVDVGWRVLKTDLVDLTPYVDVNFLDRMGMGVHVGLRMDWRLPADSLLFVRLEYRYLTRQFDAAYVNSFYEAERFRFRGGPTTKIRYLSDRRGGDGRHGFLGRLSLLLFERITVTVTYEDAEERGDSSLSFRLRLPWLGPVLFQAYYAKRNFAHAEDIFDLDDALLLAEARVRIWDFLYAYAEYAREWHLVVEGQDARYATVNDWSLGLGAAWEF